MCQGLFIEVHHIIPESQGGPDSEDNAAPLCASCHAAFGGNPDKRKTIREMRDFWYERCDKRMESEQRSPELTDLFSKVLTKDDLAQFREVYGLGTFAERMTESPFSFVREEFVHPLVVQELVGWLSDTAPTTTSVDLLAARSSNRFFGPIRVSQSGAQVFVRWEGERGESFVYTHLATSPSGVEMLQCFESGGGSGIFGHVVLLSLSRDRSLVEDNAGAVGLHERRLLKTLGSISLGDRYVGELKYEDGLLVIPADTGRFKNTRLVDFRIPVR
jgi:hypothetical protein